ncbi:MAG: glycosyltransferase family 2 protein [Rikenellaceae bacterium]
MDISVIVPIYNVENYIERCLCSLFEQTKTDGVEFILVNDSTPDSSMQIAYTVIKQYPNLNIKVLEHTENKGVAVTRQTGMDVAIGDYTIQIDSDDWCEPTMLEDLYGKAIETGADMVCCDLFIDDKVVSVNVNVKDIFLSNAIMKRWLVFWNRLIKRSLYVDNSIKLDCSLKRGGDCLVLLKLYHYIKNEVYLPKAFVHYNIKNPMSLTFNSNGLIYDFIKIFELYNLFIKDKIISNEYSRIILNDKIKLKIMGLRQYRGEKQKEIVNSLTDIDSYILKSNLFPITTKIPYFFAIHGMLPIANLIFNLSDWYNRYRTNR